MGSPSDTVASRGFSLDQAGIGLRIVLSEAVFSSSASVRSVRLGEHLSQPYAAEVEVVSPEPAARSALRGLIGGKACVTIVRSGASRSLLGTVTRVVNAGIYSARDGAADSPANLCCRYSVRIEPPLAILAATLHSRSFIGMKPPEVMRSVLADYGIADEGRDASPPILDMDGFDASQVISQTRETDLEFLHRLSRLYGINYKFVHRGGDPGDPELWLSRGWLFGDDAPVEEVRLLSDSPRLRGLEMAEDLGIDAVTLDFSDEEKDPSKARPRTVALGGAPFRTRRNISALYEVFERERVKETLEASLRRSRQRWRASGEDISLVPGVRLRILDAFGEEGSEAAEPVEALITGTTLFARASWPTGMVLPPSLESEAGEAFEQGVEALEAVPGEPAGSFAPASGEGAGEKAEFFAGLRSRAFFERGTVDESLADPSVDASEGPVLLSVSIPGSDGPVVAELAFSPAGDGTAPSVMPRPGDSVLVASCAGRFFILGSMSPAFFPEAVFDKMSENRRNGAEIRLPGGAVMRVSESDDAVDEDFVLDRVMGGSFWTWLGATAWKNNDANYLDLREKYEDDVNEAREAYKEAREQYAVRLMDTTMRETFSQEVEEARKSCSDAAGKLLEKVRSAAKELKDLLDSQGGRDDERDTFADG